MSIRKQFHSKYVLTLCGAVLAGLLSFIWASAAQAQEPMPQPPGGTSGSMSSSEPPVMDNQVFAHVRLDQFEGRIFGSNISGSNISGSNNGGSNNQLRWDGEAWIGTDMNRLWLKSEGFSNSSTVSDGDHEALYDRPIPHLRYFDAQVGVRADLDSGPHRTWAAVGVEGLAPYYFEFAPTLYIRDGGNVAGRVTGSCDLLITQRWTVQPQAEFNFYSKDDPARRIGSGLSDIDTGVRLRYEVSRKFAPYIGFAYNGRYGNTASYSTRARETTSDPRFVFGLRLWY